MSGGPRGVGEMSTDGGGKHREREASSGPPRGAREIAVDCNSLHRRRGDRQRADRGLRWPIAVSTVLAVVTPAAAEPRSTADLDGVQLWIGPSGAASHTERGWDSLWGGSVAVLRVREARALAVTGVWLGAAHYASGDRGRIWLDGVVGTRRLGGWLLGVSAGPSLDLADDHHPRPGGSIAVWGFAGVVPMVRVGAVAEAGVVVELGVSLALPALRW